MKNFKQYFFFIVIACLAISVNSCSEETLSSSKNSEEFELVSPKGFKIGNSLENLKSRLNLSNDNQIVSIKYDETGSVNVATISYNTADGKQSSIAMIKGSFKYVADIVENEVRDDSINQAKLGGPETVWVVSCSGCENCGVSSTMGSDDSVTMRCGNGQTCCVMKISKSTSLEP